MSDPEIIEGFIRSLTYRAFYGIRGEKPIAIISTLAYMHESSLVGMRLIELVEGNQHSTVINRKFLQIATRYGKIKDPKASWSVITNPKNRELQRAIEEYPKVSDAFARLDKDQIRDLYNHWLEQLKHEAASNQEASSRIMPSISVPSVPASHSGRLVADSDPYLILTNENTSIGPIEIWSERRLPFEPEGWLKEMRDKIRGVVVLLEDSQGLILKASYFSGTEARFDIENILIYNVGEGYFTNSTHNGLVLERVFSDPPRHGSFKSLYPHYQSYRMASREEGFSHWLNKRVLSRWASIRCDDLKDASRVWYQMMTGSRRMLTKRAQSLMRFGLSIIIRHPPRSMLYAASIVKPVFDGITASFQTHDCSSEDEVISRLSQKLGVDPGKIQACLHNEEFDLLGVRRLVWPWRSSVQWNPADENCVVGQLLLIEDKTVYTYELSGEIFEVDEKPHSSIIVVRA